MNDVHVLKQLELACNDVCEDLNIKYTGSVAFYTDMSGNMHSNVIEKFIRFDQSGEYCCVVRVENHNDPSYSFSSYIPLDRIEKIVNNK